MLSEMAFGTNKQNPNKCLWVVEKPKHIPNHRSTQASAVKTKSEKTSGFSALRDNTRSDQKVDTGVLVENKLQGVLERRSCIEEDRHREADPCRAKNGLCL